MVGPKGERGWECGGHGGKKQVWVRCARGIDVGIKEQNGGDWIEVQCDAGRKVVGGGCNAFTPPYKMMYNGPVGSDRWKCGGHGGSKRVWAICALGINVSTVENKGGDWTDAKCAPGQKVLGGGCNVFYGSPEFAYSGPSSDNYEMWRCGGFSGKKSVQAACWEPPAPQPCTSFASAETCPTSRCTVYEGVCKDFDFYMIANSTNVPVKKTYKDSTRDAQGCANLCGGESEAFVWSRTSGLCWCAELASDYSGWTRSDDAAYYRVGSGVFGGKACRLDKSDTTTNGKGSVKVIQPVTFAECVSKCKTESNACTGIEYGYGGKRCELWTKPIGYVLDRGGFECLNLAKPPVCSAPDASQLNSAYPCSCGLAACGDNETLCYSLQNFCDTPKPTPSPTPAPTIEYFWAATYKCARKGPFCYENMASSDAECMQQCEAWNSKAFDYIPTDQAKAHLRSFPDLPGRCMCLDPTADMFKYECKTKSVRYRIYQSTKQ
eukprot:TRINITY_DN12916_c0_g3_i1.p1 TRINITY_DN12916_c0_g3~~TRINITY_DN12916_c0_g3_i1.p1  ORF type:complete len:492 (+),score=41.70 TRINITY_DN12916_c0_g3_i1:276-1751(+)